ncbi:MAG TPA: glycoside hydrolase family protein, partial [Caulobacteraceae bacterium]|nr:glycoside hydrolase family protein [Caulobacteraceae bacterium]
MSGPALRRPGRVAAAAGLAAAVALAAPFIMRWEGDGGRVGYRDAVGVVTSCYGHTGAGAVLGRRYSRAECSTELAEDVDVHARAVAACLRAPVPRETLAAFVSFAFNAGPAAFCR